MSGSVSDAATPRRFDGRVAVVTGASRGLGRAVAERLGGLGAQLVCVSRTVGGLEELDDAVRAAGGVQALLVPLDLADGDGIDRLGAALFDRFGKVDLLIHAAAHGAPLRRAAQIAPSELEALLAVNVAATARLIRSIDPLLRLGEGRRAVFVVDRKAGRPFWGAYGASKAAAEALALSYAEEARSGDQPIEATVFEPPAMPTAMRGRTHPGDDRTSLTPCAQVAEQLLSSL